MLTHFFFFSLFQFFFINKYGASHHFFIHLLSLSLDSEEERIAVDTACQYGSKAAIYNISSANDVSIQITTDGEEPQLGSDVKLAITVTNTSSELRTFTLHGQVAIMYYTGVYKATVRKDQIPVELQPNEGERTQAIMSHSY